MLKGSQLANTVKQDTRIAVQVNHLVKPHHPQTVLNSIDHDFVQTIQSKRNASTLYLNKMKLLETDQLDKGLQQYQRKKQLTQKQKEIQRKDYRERVNGVLGDIERNMMARSRMFQSQLLRQSQKQKRFVDDNAIKQKKITQLVDKNIDTNLFQKQSDRYQQHQSIEHSLSLKTLQIQKMQLQRKRQEEKRYKQMQMKKREQHQRLLAHMRYVQQQEKIKNKIEYRLDLQKLMEEKRQKQMRKPQPSVDYRRHNPITNPIEYHIQNPYILKKLQRYNN